MIISGVGKQPEREPSFSRALKKISCYEGCDGGLGLVVLYTVVQPVVEIETCDRFSPHKTGWISHGIAGEMKM